MLTYHPAFDSYHCAYRTLLLTTKMSEEIVEIERMRIWDFYLVFPAETNRISIPRDLWSLKQSANKRPNPYEELIDPQRVFERMKLFQLAAFRYLAAFGFIESREMAHNVLKRTSKPIPNKLLSSMERLDSREQYVIQLISSPLNELSLYGDKGLKFRTKLLDFKYDIR